MANYARAEAHDRNPGVARFPYLLSIFLLFYIIDTVARNERPTDVRYVLPRYLLRRERS